MLKYIDFKNYEVQKVISEHLRNFAWAIAGIFAYFGVTQNKFVVVALVVFLWLVVMWWSLLILTYAQKIHICKG